MLHSNQSKFHLTIANAYETVSFNSTTNLDAVDNHLEPSQLSLLAKRRNAIVKNSVLNRLRRKELKKEKEHLNKTLMLLFVCFLLFSAELPNAIFIFITVFNSIMYFSYLLPTKDFLEALTLITSAINFLVYSFMSKTFRKQFKSFYKKT